MIFSIILFNNVSLCAWTFSPFLLKNYKISPFSKNFMTTKCRNFDHIFVSFIHHILSIHIITFIIFITLSFVSFIQYEYHLFHSTVLYIDLTCLKNSVTDCRWKRCASSIGMLPQRSRRSWSNGSARPKTCKPQGDPQRLPHEEESCNVLLKYIEINKKYSTLYCTQLIESSVINGCWTHYLQSFVEMSKTSLNKDQYRPS